MSHSVKQKMSKKYKQLYEETELRYNQMLQEYGEGEEGVYVHDVHAAHAEALNEHAETESSKDNSEEEDELFGDEEERILEEVEQVADVHGEVDDPEAQLDNPKTDQEEVDVEGDEPEEQEQEKDRRCRHCHSRFNCNESKLLHGARGKCRTGVKYKSKGQGAVREEPFDGNDDTGEEEAEKKCSKCSKVFSNKRNRMRHERKTECSPEGGLKCEVCNTYFKMENALACLAQHKSFSSKCSYKCRGCGSVFKNSWARYRHERENCRKWDRQDKKADKPEPKLEAEKVKDSPRSWRCACRQEFRSEEELRIHAQGHIRAFRANAQGIMWLPAINPKECTYCQAVLSSERNKDRHEKKKRCIQNPERWWYYCRKCRRKVPKDKGCEHWKPDTDVDKKKK